MGQRGVLYALDMSRAGTAPVMYSAPRRRYNSIIIRLSRRSVRHIFLLHSCSSRAGGRRLPAISNVQNFMTAPTTTPVNLPTASYVLRIARLLVPRLATHTQHASSAPKEQANCK